MKFLVGQYTDEVDHRLDTSGGNSCCRDPFGICEIDVEEPSFLLYIVDF